MAGEGGNIVRNVFGRSYKEAEHIMKDASKGTLDFKSPQENTFYGKKGGKKFDEYQEKEQTKPLQVKAVKCYEDFVCTKEIKIIEKGKSYFFKAIQYNRTPTKSELKSLKWAIQYDDTNIANAPQVTGEEKISYAVPKDRNIAKLRVYAFFKEYSPNVKAEVYLIKEEVVIIIGTEQHSTNIANKLMFPGEAVRKVRTKYPNYPFVKVALFTDGYSENQLSTITNDLIKHNKSLTVIRVTTIDDVVNIINSGNRDSTAFDNKRRVKEIFAYSHGYVRNTTNEGVIAFGYEGKGAEKQELDAKSFSKVNPAVFLDGNTSVFYSYACRTGIGTSSETTTNAFKDKSLAQKMANHGKITVYGYMRRSLYEDAWGTQNHRDTYASDHDEGGSTWENFKTDLKDTYQSDPNDMDTYNKYRKKEIKLDKAIWNPDGAYLDVKAGTWPVGVPATYEKFLPK